MTWFETAHCRSRAHCAACRALESGRAFRISVLSAFPLSSSPLEGEDGGEGSSSPDFPCPSGLPWGHVDERKAEPFAQAVATIAALPDSESGRFLKAMAAQLQDLIRRGKGCRGHLERKLFYYLATYGGQKGVVS